MGRHSTTIAPAILTPPLSPSRKRKRDVPGEIEVDINAPEPPSKKALRKAKKGKGGPAVPAEDDDDNTDSTQKEAITNNRPDDSAQPTGKRSEYGIWIGNLPWTANKTSVRQFLTLNTDMTEDSITRLHLPAPSKAVLASSLQRVKPQNKGFAYIDFSTSEALQQALALSEKLLDGRRVLIKDFKNFEGRPEKNDEEAAKGIVPGKLPSKRVFVGNLGYDIMHEDLQAHFGRCGQVDDVHVATFEDSGKCKGFAWVTFADLEGGEKAVRGWVDWEQEAEGDEEVEVLAEETGRRKKKKPRKWWVNKLHGRPLRMEFAEDKTVRYTKRYRKNGSAQKSLYKVAVDGETVPPAEKTVERSRSSFRDEKGGDGRSMSGSSGKVDARSIKPGAALAAAPRVTGGIVEGQGEKTIFE